MAYSTGSVISASDFNGLANTAVGGNVTFVWGIGSAQYGYGQSITALQTLSTGATVTAAQWSGFLAAMNGAAQHQSGAGGSLGPLNYSAGQTVTYFSNVATKAGTIFTNANLYTAQGSTTTGTNFITWANAASATAYTGQYTITRTVTFASGDAARYFFNAGGQISFVISSVTNADSTARTTSVQTLLATNVGGIQFVRNYSDGGLIGAGGTPNANVTNVGYRQLVTSLTTIGDVNNSTVGYTNNNANIRIKSDGTQGTNQDTGRIITIVLGLSAPAHAGFNDTLAAGINHRVDITYPETTYLTTSPWGTPTVA